MRVVDHPIIFRAHAPEADTTRRYSGRSRMRYHPPCHGVAVAVGVGDAVTVGVTGCGPLLTMRCTVVLPGSTIVPALGSVRITLPVGIVALYSCDWRSHFRLRSGA